MASNKPPEIPPRRHSSTVLLNKIFNQIPGEESQPNSPSFLSRRHSSCIDGNMDSETDETMCLALAACCALQLVSANKGSYKYGYGVADSSTGDVKEQQETKDGDQVTGYYKMLEADGRTRTVKYESSPLTGFRAQVSHSSEPLPATGLNAKSWSSTHRLDHISAADNDYAAPALIPLQKLAYGWSDGALRYAAAAPYAETKSEYAIDHGQQYARYNYPWAAKTMGGIDQGGASVLAASSRLLAPTYQSSYYNGGFAGAGLAGIENLEYKPAAVAVATAWPAAARIIQSPALQAAPSLAAHIPAYQSSYIGGMTGLTTTAAAADILPAAYSAPKYFSDAPLIASTAAPCY